MTTHATSLTDGEIVEENAVEAQSPPVGIAVGSGRLARLQFWSALEDWSMYALRIREDGMRDGYVHTGSARMTVMDPDGTLDTWHLKEGDVYFIPRAYPHHIESSTRPICTSQSSSTSRRPATSAIARLAPTLAKCSRRRSTCTSTTCRTPVHQDRSADRHPQRPRRRIRNGRRVSASRVAGRC
jgi:hypothetical protein